MNKIISLSEQTIVRPAWRQALLVLFGAVAGSLLLAASAKIQVPFYPVPMTLQTFALALLCLGIRGTLGLRIALASVVLYLVEGAAGIPVFAGPVSGIPYLFGPTGGYLLGFIPAVFFMGYACSRQWHKSVLLRFGVILGGFAIIYACGYSWLALGIGYEKAFVFGVAPFILGDVLKALLATVSVSVGCSLINKFKKQQ